jgi:hypothetical protein
MSRYKSGVAQSFPGILSSQNSWQRHREVVRLSALRTGRIYPQEIILVLISVRGWADLRAIVRSEGLYQWKIPIKPSGIEPATFRFVAQNLNHCATAVPRCFRYNHKFMMGNICYFYCCTVHYGSYILFTHQQIQFLLKLEKFNLTLEYT